MATGIRFSEMLAALNHTWADQPRRVRVLAARLYVGADTVATLRDLTTTRPCHKHADTAPSLSAAELDTILKRW